MKPYSDLTVRGQARRLRLLAIDALRQYDLQFNRLCLVNNNFNGIFRVDTQDGQKLILRVTLPQGGHDRDHVAAEMAWLKALSAETNLSVPQPLAARDGSFVVEAAAPGVPEARLCEIFTWVPGTDLARQITPGNLEKMGRLMAQLHQHALSYSPPAGLSLLKFDRVFPFPEPVVLFDPQYAGYISAERRELYLRAQSWVQQAIDLLKSSGEPMRLLHGDLHQENVRVFRGVLSPIDFEDLMWGWPVQDIGTSLYYLQDEESYPQLITAFKTGYSTDLPWPERYPGEIDAFLVARGLGVANFILNDPNPEYLRQIDSFLQRLDRRLQRLLPGRNRMEGKGDE
jgi:Ser/Thr protein kinase RdoA (MazF antagonist)